MLDQNTKKMVHDAINTYDLKCEKSKYSIKYHVYDEFGDKVLYIVNDNLRKQYTIELFGKVIYESNQHDRGFFDQILMKCQKKVKKSSYNSVYKQLMALYAMDPLLSGRDR